MLANSLKFFGVLSAVLLLAGFTHFFILKNLGFNPANVLLVRSYIVNVLLAQLIFVVLDVLKNKKSNALGFVFMGGSLIKFAAFFVLFYPTYNADGDADKIEFLAFFVPYALSLILETYTLVKILNKS